MPNVESREQFRYLFLDISRVSDHKGVSPLVTYHHMYPCTTYQCKQMNKYILVYGTFARKMPKQLKNHSRMHKS